MNNQNKPHFSELLTQYKKSVSDLDEAENALGEAEADEKIAKAAWIESRDALANAMKEYGAFSIRRNSWDEEYYVLTTDNGIEVRKIVDVDHLDKAVVEESQN